ncbi:MAG: type II secretion system GspH family protein [Lentisphaeraceae bacterium]|nr:type II secretion system GspH family protein [Lentisphaeraceae bacterium]
MRMFRCKGVGRRSFTLIELLVVVAIIGILASLLLPSLRNSRDMAYRAVCASNLKQVGVGSSLFSKDDNGNLPTWFRTGNSNFASYWMFYNGRYRGIGLLYEAEYLKTEEIFYCPAHSQQENALLKHNGTGNTWGGIKWRSSFTSRAISDGTGGIEVETDWKLINYADKVTYTDFVGVNNWTNGTVSIYWPHKNTGFNRLLGEGSVKWVRPGSEMKTASSSTPGNNRLLRMYQELEDD